MFYIPNNHVRTAVDRVGGATKASNLLGVANQTISTWLKNGRVPNIDYAAKLAELSGLKVQDLRSTR